jgi:hypothetical protein
MPGLVPGIHVLAAIEQEKTWMAGTSPAMTEKEARDKPARNGRMALKASRKPIKLRPLAWAIQVGYCRFGR